MLKLEDRSFEKFSLGRHGDVALPISVFLGKDGELTVTAYRKVKGIAKRFLKNQGIAFPSEDSLSALKGELDCVMKRYDYEYDADSALILEFELTHPSEHNGVSTVILITNRDVTAYTADTTLWNLEVDDEDDADVICAVIQNGRIAAFASVNDMSDDGGLEINVECAPMYRKRGFGSSCAAGLANYLLGNSLTDKVHYKCRAKNEASAMTARRAGFEFAGRRFTFVYRRGS